MLSLNARRRLLPWLFPLAQYARYGPFDGQDYGLPRHYFWGAPESWAQALDLRRRGDAADLLLLGGLTLRDLRALDDALDLAHGFGLAARHEERDVAARRLHDDAGEAQDAPRLCGERRVE